MESTAFSLSKDKDLWQKFKDGDKQAFIKIYEHYYPSLFNYGMKIKHNADFIKDCIQETFCDLLAHVKTLGDTDSILFYLLASLRRKIFRKVKYDISFRIDENQYFSTFKLDDSSSEDIVIDKESMRIKKKMIKSVIENLPPRQKEALLMKFYLNFSYPDIAQMMGVNVQSVRNLIHSSIKTLRVQIKNKVP